MLYQKKKKEGLFHTVLKKALMQIVKTIKKFFLQKPQLYTSESGSWQLQIG
jgi:hypothetical protein